jgi:hypothetical protein
VSRLLHSLLDLERAGASRTQIRRLLEQGAITRAGRGLYRSPAAALTAWLMTSTAILPDFGFSNGRDVSLCSVSHASGSTSAFSVVLSAL